MSFKKILGIFIVSILMLHVTCVMSCEELGLDLHALSVDHKQLAAQLIAEAQAAHKDAESRRDHLSAWVRSQPTGISMSSLHRSGARLAELGVAAIKINKLNKLKDSAAHAITACTSWRNSTREDCQEGVRCHQAIDALRKLAKIS